MKGSELEGETTMTFGSVRVGSYEKLECFKSVWRTETHLVPI